MTPRTIHTATTKPHASAMCCATAATATPPHRYTHPHPGPRPRARHDACSHPRHDVHHPPHATPAFLLAHAASVASSHPTTVPRPLLPHHSTPTPAPDALSGTTRGTSPMRSTRRSSSSTPPSSRPRVPRRLSPHYHPHTIDTVLVPSSMRRAAVPATPAHAAVVRDGRHRVLHPPRAPRPSAAAYPSQKHDTRARPHPRYDAHRRRRALQLLFIANAAVVASPRTAPSFSEILPSPLAPCTYRPPQYHHQRLPHAAPFPISHASFVASAPTGSIISVAASSA
ncbi:hypothetical protein C8R44DRAFT_815310 [Mycena epipterygia]|nr:hypothetical protein C8R44DRAFT_815310 [Mycena epipterygia]